MKPKPWSVKILHLVLVQATVSHVHTFLCFAIPPQSFELSFGWQYYSTRQESFTINQSINTMSIVEKPASTTVSPWAAQVEKVTVQSMVVQQIKKKFWIKHLPKLVAYKSIVSEFPITMKKIQEIDIDPDAVSLFASESICHGIVQSSLMHDLGVLHQAMNESLEPIQKRGTSEMIACMKSLHGHSSWKLMGLNPLEDKESFTSFVKHKIQAYCAKNDLLQQGGSPPTGTKTLRVRGTSTRDDTDDTVQPLETPSSGKRLRKRPKVAGVAAGAHTTTSTTPALRRISTRIKTRQEEPTEQSTTTRVTPPKSRKARVHFQQDDDDDDDDNHHATNLEKAETLALSLDDTQRMELYRVLHHTLSAKEQDETLQDCVQSFTPKRRMVWMKELMHSMSDKEKERLWKEVASIKIQFHKHK